MPNLSDESLTEIDDILYPNDDAPLGEISMNFSELFIFNKNFLNFKTCIIDSCIYLIATLSEDSRAFVIETCLKTFQKYYYITVCTWDMLLCNIS